MSTSFLDCVQIFGERYVFKTASISAALILAARSCNAQLKVQKDLLPSNCFAAFGIAAYFKVVAALDCSSTDL